MTDGAGNTCHVCNNNNENKLRSNEVLRFKQYEDLQYTTFVGYVCDYHIYNYKYNYTSKKFELKSDEITNLKNEILLLKNRIGDLENNIV